jgi:hypothetical protein
VRHEGLEAFLYYFKVRLGAGLVVAFLLLLFLLLEKGGVPVLLLLFLTPGGVIVGVGIIVVGTSSSRVGICIL